MDGTRRVLRKSSPLVNELSVRTSTLAKVLEGITSRPLSGISRVQHDAVGLLNTILATYTTTAWESIRILRSV